MEDYLEVRYDERRWRLLREKREKALKVMTALKPLNIPTITHGSIARGDVDEDSDVDVVIVEPPRPFSLIEFYLESRGFKIYRKIIVQAHPGYTPKAYLHLDPGEELIVSFPLAPLKPREREFYRWGGEVGPGDLATGTRVPGVNKELRLIIPKPWGHIEYSVIGREGEAARILGVSIETVLERVRVLTRRREVGRTGLFLEEELDPSEPVEEAIKRLASRNRIFRRAIGL